MAGIFDLFKKIETARAAPQPVSRIIAGLGNPGAKYEATRHNTGFLCLDYIASRYGVTGWRIRFKGLCAECVIDGVRVLLLKPQTFMNASGESVREALEFYKLPPEALTVLCDDVNFPCGRMRIRKSGSDGGHNGLKSIIYLLNSDVFARIRIGAGEKPTPEYDLADWVLSRFTETEAKSVTACFANAAEAVALINAGRTEEAMSRYNGTGK